MRFTLLSLVSIALCLETAAAAPQSRLRPRAPPTGVDDGAVQATLKEGLADLRSSKAGQRQDLSKLVNPFIGTAANNNPGNVCPGA